MNSSVLSVLLLLLVSTLIAAASAQLESTTPSEYDAEQSEALEEDGNGFESEGIDGHRGLFRVFDWSKEELQSISLWHATAQYQNVVELVKVRPTFQRSM